MNALRRQKVVLERLDFGAPALVALRIHLRDMRRHRVHILLRLLQRHTRFHSPHYQQPVKVMVELFRLKDQRYRQLVLSPILVARRLHADYCIRLAVEAQGGAHDLSICPQLQPQLMGEDHHVFMAGLPFLRQEVPSQEQRLALHLQQAWGDEV